LEVSAMKRVLVIALAVLCGFGMVRPAFTQDKLTGEIKIDGSSTVYLITESMATDFKKLHPAVNISVGISGTGGGFKKFAAGETDISDASRKIKPGEVENCAKNKITFAEIQVAWDGLAVVIHKDNNWANKMTVEQLKKIWEPNSTVKKWSDVDPAWPAEPILLYGAGPDSGTFDYFTEAINGKEKATRTDYTASEDDNTLVQGVARNKYAMGYFGLAYYEGHKDKLNVVSIAAKNGDDFVTPSVETVLSNSYKPLSRPLYIYIKTSSLARPEVRQFAEFYMRRTDLVAASKYVPLSALQLRTQNAALKKAIAQ
jgi:phosphate transport system substrate-binding protein